MTLKAIIDEAVEKREEERKKAEAAKREARERAEAAEIIAALEARIQLALASGEKELVVMEVGSAGSLETLPLGASLVYEYLKSQWVGDKCSIEHWRKGDRLPSGELCLSLDK